MNEKDIPNTCPGAMISRDSCCTNFLKRRSLLPEKCSCWFCQYAWFEEEGDCIPEKGVCKYPIRQTN